MKNNDLHRDDHIVAASKLGAMRSTATGNASAVRNGAALPKRKDQPGPRKGPSAPTDGVKVIEARQSETLVAKSEKASANAALATVLKEELTRLPAAVKRAVIDGLNDRGKLTEATICTIECLYEELVTAARCDSEAPGTSVRSNRAAPTPGLGITQASWLYPARPSQCRQTSTIAAVSSWQYCSSSWRRFNCSPCRGAAGHPHNRARRLPPPDKTEHPHR